MDFKVLNTKLYLSYLSVYVHVLVTQKSRTIMNNKIFLSIHDMFWLRIKKINLII